MKELKLSSSASLLMVTLSLSIVFSGLFHANLQNVIARKNLTYREWDNNAVQYRYQMHNNKKWEKLQVLPILYSNSISHDNTLWPPITHQSYTVTNASHHYQTITTNFSAINGSGVDSNSNKTIAFVENTFTYAAYRNGSFYDFYKKYIPITERPSTISTITTDLNLLKNRPIPHGPFAYYAHPTTKTFLT